MTSSRSSLDDSLEKLRGWFQKRSHPGPTFKHDHSPTTGVLTVSKPILAFCSSHCLPTTQPTLSAQVPTSLSTVCRNTSDAAQTWLPPVQAVADVIPGVGGVIKGAIGGILSILQLVDRYIQNKGDLEKLTLRLHLLRHHIDNAPISRTTFEETMRLRLLDALQTTKSQLEGMETRIRGAPSLSQDVAGCIATLNNHLFEYMVLSQMQLQNDISEIKASMVEYHSRHMQLVEHYATSGSAVQLPMAMSRGYAILVDATGREHTMLLDQCQRLDQLSAMLSVVLFQCRPDEAEVQKWYIERKLYDFVIYNKTNSDVTQLTSESNVWSKMESGTKIVMRAIVEEFAQPTSLTATYKCPCGTLNTVNASMVEVVAAFQRGCNITCQHCERRFQVVRTREERMTMDDTACVKPAAETKHLLRNFLARQVVRGYHAMVTGTCMWMGGDGSVCGVQITSTTVPQHLAAHGIKNMTRNHPLSCKWLGCRLGGDKPTINRNNIVRHVREVHLGHKRLRV